MHSDENTLPDDVDEALVVAAHRRDGSADDVVLAHLDDPTPRSRVRALRATVVTYAAYFHHSLGMGIANRQFCSHFGDGKSGCF